MCRQEAEFVSSTKENVQEKGNVARERNVQERVSGTVSPRKIRAFSRYRLQAPSAAAAPEQENIDISGEYGGR